MAAINNMIRKYGAMDEIFGQEQYAQIPMAVVGIVMKSIMPQVIPFVNSELGTVVTDGKKRGFQSR